MLLRGYNPGSWGLPRSCRLPGTLSLWENDSLPPQAREEAGNGVRVGMEGSWHPQGMSALSLSSLDPVNLSPHLCPRMATCIHLSGESWRCWTCSFLWSAPVLLPSRLFPYSGGVAGIATSCRKSCWLQPRRAAWPSGCRGGLQPGRNPGYSGFPSVPFPP